jgi:hypothetical protein
LSFIERHIYCGQSDSTTTSSSAAGHIYSLRIGTRSVWKYESKINAIKSFVQKGGYQEDGQGKLVLPISLAIKKDIWLRTSIHLPKRKRGNYVEGIDVVIEDDIDDNYCESSVIISASCSRI